MVIKPGREVCCMPGKEKAHFIAALLAGVVAALAFVFFYAGEQVAELANYFVLTGRRIQELDLDYSHFLKIVLQIRGREFLFLFFLSMIRFGKGIQLLYCGYITFSQTMILMGMNCVFGWKGILVWLAYGIPQFFLYGFSVYYVIAQRDRLQQILYRKHPMSNWFLALGVYVIGIGCGILTETFVNPMVLDWILRIV